MQQTTGNKRLMVKKVGLLLAALALAVALMIAAVPASAQQGEVTVIGVIQKKDSDLPLAPDTGLYFITDEETGAERDLLDCNDTVSIENFEGQRVTVSGIPQTQGEPSTGEEPLCVTAIEPAGQENDNGGESGVQPQCFLPEGCFLSGDGSDETVAGGIGPDYIIGGGGHDAVYGLGGGDWLDGGAGDDLVRGDAGDDLVDGGSGHDLVRGNDGNDYVTGYLGNDILDAGGGSDYVYAADGEFDEVSGGPQYDVCVVDWFDDVSGCEEVYTE